MTLPPRFRASGPIRLTALLAAGLLPFAPLPVDAQEPPSAWDTPSPLQGRVLDESSLNPIADATVTLIGTDLITETDAEGAFTFQNPPFGLARVRVASPDHVSMVEEVELRTDAIVRVEFQLPPISAALAGLFVTGSAEGPSGEPRTAADLVARQVSGLLAPVGGLGEVERSVRLRGPTSFTLGLDEPTLFVDGVRVAGPFSVYDVLTQIPAGDVEEVKILRGPAAAFRYAFAADGVILIRTRGH